MLPIKYNYSRLVRKVFIHLRLKFNFEGSKGCSIQISAKGVSLSLEADYFSTKLEVQKRWRFSPLAGRSLDLAS